MSLSNVEDGFMDQVFSLQDETNINHISCSNQNDSNSNERSLKKRGFLNNEDRNAICQMLLGSSDVNGNLFRAGIVTQLASTYNVHRSVIYRIWKQFKDTGSACHNRALYCGRKRIQLDLEIMRQVPLPKWSTFRSLANALNVSKTSLVRLHKAGVIRRHTNTLKPYLKEDNMIARLRYCLSMIDSNSLPHNPKFNSMHNIVFIDEKWFYITRNKVNNYLHMDEEEPQRTCKSKNFITKVMFLCAVTRPRFDNEKNESFSGKIGIFPFVYEQPTRRSIVNRVAWTMETKPITSVTKEVNKTFLINKVLPAIENMWPREDVGKTIFIQQDNARSHISINDPDFCEAASESEFNIQLVCQPPNSPDLNVLDLGFFNAIQSLQQKEQVKSIDDLIGAVQKAFHDFSTVQSNKIFCTLQSCMIEIMKIKGSNKYKIPHMKKDVLYNQGDLPTQMSCDSSLIQEVIEYVQNYDAM